MRVQMRFCCDRSLVTIAERASSRPHHITDLKRARLGFPSYFWEVSGKKTGRALFLCFSRGIIEDLLRKLRVFGVLGADNNYLYNWLNSWARRLLVKLPLALAFGLFICILVPFSFLLQPSSWFVLLFEAQRVFECVRRLCDEGKGWGSGSRLRGNHLN